MESAEENQNPVSAHHMYGEMASSNSTNKTAAAAERSDSLQNAANFSGVRKRKRGEYVAEKWDPIMKKRVWLGTYNTAEEAAEAYLAKQCEFASAHHMFDEMPSSNSSIKTAAAADGKKPFIQEISFRGKSTLLAAEWHNMGKLRKRTFKKKQVCKSFNTNMQGKEPVESCKQTSCSMSKSSDRCNAIKRNPKSKSGLLGIRKQKNGRYSAEIRDPIKHKQVWLGTFDTLEEASQAYLSKKSEFDMLTQGNKENKQKYCDEAHPESSVGASLSSLGRKMDSPKAMRIVGVRKNQWGKYTSEIINPISKKKIWLGTFSTYEEASQAYKSKKLEFREIVKPKKKCSKKYHSNAREKQVGKEKLVVTSERFQPESAAQETFHANQNMKFNVQRSKEAVLKSNMPFDFSTREKQAGKEKFVVNCEGFQPESAAEETFHANQYMKFGVQRSKEAELKSNMAFDFSTREKQAGKEKFVVNCEGFRPESAAQETFHANQNMKFNVQRSKESELKSNMPFDFSTREKQAGKEKFVVNCEGFQPESAAQETFHANQYMTFDVQRSKEAELKSNMPFDFSTGEKQTGKEKFVVYCEGFQPESAAEETFHANQNMKFDVQRSKEAMLKSNMPFDFSTGEKQAGKEKFVVNCEGFRPESAAQETFHANQNMKFDVQRSKEAELKSNMPFDFSTGEKQAGKEKFIVNCGGFQPESAAEETFHANQYMTFDVQRSKEAELKSNMPFDFSTGENQAGKEKFVVNGEGFQPESAAQETFHADQCLKFDVWSSKEAELQSKMPVDFSTGEKQGGREDADLSMGQWVQLPDGREVKFSLELGLPIIDNYGSLLGEFSGMDNLRIYDESIY